MLTVETYETLSEAAGAMGDRTRYLAGGTLVMRDVTYADPSFDKVVRARTLDRLVATDAGGLKIGAGATMSDILATRDADFLHAVARSVGGPQVRNMATVGGNLFAPNPYGDFAVALLALDASAVMSDGRKVPVADVLANRDRSGGLVSAITLARPESGAFIFKKVSRVKPKGVSVLSIAVNQRQNDPRVVFGNMAALPTRSVGAERELARGPEAAAAACLEGLSPIDDALATAWYRAEVAPVHLRRLLQEGGRF